MSMKNMFPLTVTVCPLDAGRNEEVEPCAAILEKTITIMNMVELIEDNEELGLRLR